LGFQSSGDRATEDRRWQQSPAGAANGARPRTDRLPTGGNVDCFANNPDCAVASSRIRHRWIVKSRIRRVVESRIRWIVESRISKI
jgi:hypothetical protein